MYFRADESTPWLQLQASWDAIGAKTINGSDSGQFLIYGGTVGARFRVVQRYAAAGTGGPIRLS